MSPIIEKVSPDWTILQGRISFSNNREQLVEMMETGKHQFLRKAVLSSTGMLRADEIDEIIDCSTISDLSHLFD